MKDQQRIAHLWPDAPADAAVFTHLELKFDLIDDKVTTETAAKDVQGEAYYKHILNTKTDSSISFTGTDVTSYRPPSASTNPTEPAAVPTTAYIPEQAVTVPSTETYSGYV